MDNELIAFESHEATGGNPWLAWIAQAEQIVGHALDGDQTVDGYSLDFALDAFRTGKTPKEYVATIPLVNRGV